MTTQSTAKVLQDLKIRGLLSSWPNNFWKIGSVLGIVGVAFGVHAFALSGAEEVPAGILFQLWNLLLVDLGLEAFRHEKKFHPDGKQPNLRMRAAEVATYAIPISCFFLGIGVFIPNQPEGSTIFLVSAWLGTSILIAGAVEAFITRSMVRTKGELRLRDLEHILWRLLRILIYSLPFAAAIIGVKYYFGRPPGPPSTWLVTLDRSAKVIASEKIDYKPLTPPQHLNQDLIVRPDGGVAFVIIQADQSCGRNLGRNILRLQAIDLGKADTTSSLNICLPVAKNELIDWTTDPEGNVFILHEPIAIGEEAEAIVSKISANGQEYDAWGMAEVNPDITEKPRALAVGRKGRITMAFDLSWENSQSAVAIKNLKVSRDQEQRKTFLAVDQEMIIAINKKGKAKRARFAGEYPTSRKMSVTPGLLRVSEGGILLGAMTEKRPVIIRIRDLVHDDLRTSTPDLGVLHDLILNQSGDIIYAGASAVHDRPVRRNHWVAIKRLLRLAPQESDDNAVASRKTTTWVMGQILKNGINRPFQSRQSSVNEGAALKIVLLDRGSVMIAGRTVNALSGTSGSDWSVRKFAKNGVESTIARAVLGGAGQDYLINSVTTGDGKILVIGTGFGYSLSRNWKDIRL